ncbi:MAG: metal ABC transporter permease, partial [Chloroflexi bacterium]|nr:metal ABC transporter permease [Chloroflexota bacterium]
FTVFDPEVAQIFGVRTEWIDTLFALMLAGVVITSMQVIGVTLIAAAIVIPAVVARLLTDSFHRMIGLAGFIGTACGVIGLYSSYYLDVSSGATIVLVQAGLFCAVLAGVQLHRRWMVRGNLSARRALRPIPDERELLD